MKVWFCPLTECRLFNRIQTRSGLLWIICFVWWFCHRYRTNIWLLGIPSNICTTSQRAQLVNLDDVMKICNKLRVWLETGVGVSHIWEYPFRRANVLWNVEYLNKTKAFVMCIIYTFWCVNGINGQLEGNPFGRIDYSFVHKRFLEIYQFSASDLNRTRNRRYIRVSLSFVFSPRHCWRFDFGVQSDYQTINRRPARKIIICRSYLLWWYCRF